MIVENVDRRVLGAVRFVSAVSGTQLKEPMSVTANRVRFFQNRGGHYVIMDAPGLREHTHSFDSPPAPPPIGSVTIPTTVRDPLGRFLPRMFTLRLPRDPDPANVVNANSLFVPMRVAMYPAPTSSAASGWASIRVSVSNQNTGELLNGALLRVTRATADGTELLGHGLSDDRGEALVAISGIPVTTWGDDDAGQVVITQIDATLEAVFDPNAGAIADPDSLEANRDTLPSASMPVQIASGRQLSVSLAVPIP